MYRITTEPDRALIRIDFLGFWDAGVMASFVKAEQTAVASLGCAPGQHMVLADVSTAMLQSQEIVSAFNMFINSAQMKARRLVFVTGDAALRMQARRLLVRPGLGIAATVEEGEAFLFASDGDMEIKAA